MQNQLVRTRMERLPGDSHLVVNRFTYLTLFKSGADHRKRDDWLLHKRNIHVCQILEQKIGAAGGCPRDLDVPNAQLEVLSRMLSTHQELIAVGRPFEDALRSIPNDQVELDHWTRFGLIEKNLVKADWGSWCLQSLEKRARSQRLLESKRLS